MLKNLRNSFGVTKIDYSSLERIKPKMIKANLTMTTILSTFATVLISALLILSFFFKGVSRNRNVYIIGLILSLTIAVLCLTVAKKHSGIVRWLVYISYTIYYMYGILIGTITDPNEKTVTFMVLLVFMPTLFIDWPMRIVSITSFFDVLFIALCYRNKTGDVVSVDIIDSIVFSILGLASGFVVNNIKIRGFILEQHLNEISKIDVLTQMKNRNAYELEKDSILSTCKQTLAVIFIDVNGLHEINNLRGHDKGDIMLKFISSQIKNTFSEELTFRIGGDEFVCFVVDTNQEHIEDLLNYMVEKIEKEEDYYHVAVGYEISKVKHLSLDSLINEAEKKMLNNKGEFYKNIANRTIRNQKLI